MEFVTDPRGAHWGWPRGPLAVGSAHHQCPGSFTAAAQELGLTQSAVSQHVALLERHLELTLVERRSRPAALTEAGHTLSRHGRSLLARLGDAEEELWGWSTAGPAGCGWAASRPRSRRSCHRRSRGSARRRARTTLTIVDDHLQGLLPRLAGGELDLALVYDAPGRDLGTADLEMVELFEDPFQVVLPERHRLAEGRAPLDLSALREEPWIGGTRDSSWFGIVRDACHAAGFEPSVAFSSDDYRGVQAFVAAGLGVAVVPGLAVAAVQVTGTRVRRLRSGGPSRRVLAARPQDAFPTAATTLMVERLVAATTPFRR